jgi:cytochrome P450
MVETAAITDAPFVDMSTLPQSPVAYATFDALREQTWLAKSQFGVHVLTYDACHELLRDPRFSIGVPQLLEHAGITDPVVRAQWLDALLGATSADHDRMRRLMSPSFTPKAIAGLADYIGDRTRRAAARADSDETVDLMADIATGLPPAVFCRMIGAPEADAPAIGRLSDQVLRMFARQPELAPVIEAATHELIEYVHGFVEDRRAGARGDDLISSLLAAEEGGERLSTHELVTLLVQVLQASTDNTASQLGLVVHAATQDPDRWQALRADPASIPGFVEEASRLWPRIMHITRMAEQDLTFRDVALPQGTLMFVTVPSAHRDATVHPDPLRFDAARADKAANLNYGSAAHFCLGASLARLEMGKALEALTRVWRRVEPAGDPTFTVNVGVVTVTSLPLAVEVAAQ